MPSSAGGPWSGVAEIRKLIGARALERLGPYKRERVIEVVKRFLIPGGVAVTFQKDAWNGLRSVNDPAYSINLAKTGSLKETLAAFPHIPLLGVPPTRLVGPTRRVLHQLLIDEDWRLQ